MPIPIDFGTFANMDLDKDSIQSAILRFFLEDLQKRMHENDPQLRKRAFREDEFESVCGSNDKVKIRAALDALVRDRVLECRFKEYNRFYRLVR